MTRSDRLDDATVDALVSGQVPPGRDDLGPVAEFVAGVRAVASVQHRPNAALAVILTDGLSTDKGDLPATAGSNVHGPAPQAAGLPKRRRKMLEIALAKLASLGIAAKVGIASAAVVATTTGAGAAGALPDPLQDVVADSVSAVTPFEIPRSDRATPADRAPEHAPADVGRPDAGDPDANDHGQQVSETARTTDAEGCDRGHEVARAAGGQPDDCPDGEEVAEDGDAGAEQDLGDEGLETADQNAGEHGQEGRDTARDAREDAPSGPPAGDGSVEGDVPAEQPDDPGAQSGDAGHQGDDAADQGVDAAEEGQVDGEDGADGQTEAEEGQEQGATAAEDGRANAPDRTS